MKLAPLAITLLEATYAPLLCAIAGAGVADAYSNVLAQPIASTNLRGGGRNGDAIGDILTNSEESWLMETAGGDLGDHELPPHSSNDAAQSSNRRQMQGNSLLGTWELCSASDQCLSGCCASPYSSDGRLRCTPLEGGFRPDICVVTHYEPPYARSSVTTQSTGNSVITLSTGTCGDGSRGDGICADGTCCSEFGWCGVTPEHCAASGGGSGATSEPTPAPSTEAPTTQPPSTQAPSSQPPSTGTCGGGNRGDGVCADGTCCSEFGWCGTTPEHCAASGGGNGGGNTGGTQSPSAGTKSVTSPAITLTAEQIKVGIQVKGDDVSVPNIIVDTINEVTKGYSLYRQLAFVTHTIWESGSYQFREEIDTSNYGNYQDCDFSQDGLQLPTNDKLYYGRGYLQLSWCANYKAYGADRMYQGDADLFYKQPELVATDDFIAMDSAAWFFENRVTDTTGQFGLTTQAINGEIECSGGSSATAKMRYEIFVALANAVGMSGYSESGCYN